MWEIAIKGATGKLHFDRPIVAAVLALGFGILPVAGAPAEHAGGLPPYHNDPFDRLIIAQAIWRGWSSAPRTGGCCPTGRDARPQLINGSTPLSSSSSR